MTANPENTTMPGNKIFVSHAHADSPLVQEIAKLIKRVSLELISVWHTSDNDGVGGIGAGEIWSDAIRRNLEESRMVIALITNRSINRPSIYFETGCGAG